MVIKYLLALILVILFLPCAAASDAPNVTLASPNDGVVYTTNNITFVCNATDDENVFNVSLYHNISGEFGLYNTKRVMELEADSDTLLMCHFNNTYTCEDGEAGTNTSTDFVPGMFAQGVRINNSDTLVYPTSGNIEYNKGSIEFWFKTGFNASSDTAWLFSTGTSNADEIQIYVQNSNLSFEFYDCGYALKRASKNVSTWKENEWHFLTAIWDIYNYVGSGEVVDLFLDGSNESVIYDADYYGYDQFGNSMYLGSYADGTEQANSTLDEFRISDRARSPGEINASYLKGSGNHSSESVNWTLTSIPDGAYIWNCLVYDNESQGSWNDTNFTFTIDTSPPAVNSIEMSPGSPDEIDPGVTINVTANLTDFSNVSAAIFQYKHDAEWINVSMNNISDDLWNTSFSTISSERVYYYRIWSNDTLGQSNASQISAVNSTWDYTWNRAPSYIDAYGFVSSVSSVGVIRINNTGDDTLIITLADTWRPLLDTYYNTTEQFSIAGGDVIDINVTAEYASSDSSVNMTITMSAEPSAPEKTASPVSSDTLVTMNSYSGGPYFDVNIVTIPLSVEQSQTSINLSASAKNIGNETAEEVWLNWTLSPGWTNASGDLNRYIGNITSKSTNTSSLVVTVGSSAQSGIATVCVNVSAKGDVSNHDCGVVGVSCSDTDGTCGAGCTYANDADCPRPSGGAGTTTVYAGGIALYDMLLEIPDSVEVFRGDDVSFQACVSNPNLRKIEEIELEVSGYSPALTEIVKSVTELRANSSYYFEIMLEVPEYIETGTHVLDIRVSGMVANHTLERSKGLSLIVRNVSLQEAQKAVKLAEKALEELEKEGVDSITVSGLVNESRTLLDQGDYDGAREKAEQAIGIKEAASEAFADIAALEASLWDSDSMGFPVPESRKLLSLSMASFLREDYPKARERAEKARLAFLIETGGMLPVLLFLYRNILYIPFISLGAFFAFLSTRKKLVLASVRKSLERLDKEVLSLKGALKGLQRGLIHASNYSEVRRGMESIEDRMIEIVKERARLEGRKTKLEKASLQKAVLKEMETLREQASMLQEDYFKTRGVTKRFFERANKELISRMAELQGETELYKGKKGQAGLSVILVGFLMLLALSGGVLSTSEQDALDSINQARLDIKDMGDLGFGTLLANHTLEEVLMLFETGRYEAAEALAVKVGKIKEAAMEIDSIIDQTEEEIYNVRGLGLNVSIPEEQFGKGLEAFYREDYQSSRGILMEALNELDRIREAQVLEASQAAGPVQQALDFILLNWIPLLVLLACLTSASLSYKLFWSKRRVKKRIEGLKREKEGINEALKVLQRDYYLGNLGKIQYEIMVGSCKKRIGSLERDISRLAA